MTANLKNGKKCETETFYLENELLSPYTYLTQVRGKELRFKVAMAFNYWLQVPAEKLSQLLETASMLHVGGLMIDDIQDDSRIRRGLPASHLVYGIPQTINASLYAIFLAIERAFDLSPKVSKVLSETFLEALHGQGTDIYWRDSFVCPTENQYYKMVQQKTGSLLKGLIQIMQIFSENTTDYSELILVLGTYFQIRDDYCNLTQQEALEEWPEDEDKLVCKESSFCEDVTEGKFSLPVIHAVQTEYREQILHILRQRTRDMNIKKYFVSLLEKAGSLQYTRNVLEDLDEKARAEVARLGGNRRMEAVLDELLSWRT